MNRILITLIITLTIASAVSAAECTPPDGFSVDLSTDTIVFPGSIEAATTGSPITLELTPTDDDIENLHVERVEAVATGVEIIFFVVSTGENEYELTPNIRIGSGVSLDDLSGLDFEVSAYVEYERDGEQVSERICLDDLTGSVLGDIEATVADFERVLQEFSDAETAFDVVDALLGTGRVFADAQCRSAEQTYALLNDSFADHCAPWSDAIVSVIDDSADPSIECATSVSDPAAVPSCIANLTGAPGGADCLALYDRMLKAERNVSASCSRNECAPVVTVESHAGSYLDPLGRSRCVDADVSDPACRAEFERVQAPRCPSVNVTALAESGQAAPTLPSIGGLCSMEEPRDDIVILKDPAADLVSSVSCMCLPALQGHVDQLEQLYEWGSACIGAENETRDCQNASYAFICDMVVGSALQCGGLGFQEYSGSANLFATRSGEPLDFEDPDEVRRQISEGGIVRSAGGEASIDTELLAHGICDTALGTGEIDWASVLNYDATSGETGRLCPEGAKLNAPCICDISAASIGGLDRCGQDSTRNQCIYDIENRDATCQAHDVSLDPNAIELPTPAITSAQPQPIPSPDPQTGEPVAIPEPQPQTEGETAEVPEPGPQPAEPVAIPEPQPQTEGETVNVDTTPLLHVSWSVDEARKAITSWDPGIYGEGDRFAVIGCTQMSNSVMLEVEAHGYSRHLTLSNGPQGRPATQLYPGGLYLRELTCIGDQVEIEYHWIPGDIA